MKIFYMLILLVYMISLGIQNHHLYKINFEIGKDINKDLRNINLLLTGQTAIAICIIGALG